MIRIKSVHPIPPATLYVEWADGLQGPIDLAEWIATGSGLIAPLKDAAIFATARVGERGASVEWGEGGDLAIDAAHLMLKIHVARPDEFSVHEAMHMASVFGDLVAQRLMEHPAIVARPDWFRLAEEAQEKLFDLYQAIGREHLAKD